MSDDSDFEKYINPDVTILDTNSKTFDTDAGKTWIYPVNYPIREYQFNMIQKALFHNTLVSLPTGLGKTFIAAVVMYNFYRWYPSGKILFLAPTRPLVKQQMDACYNITAIPKGVTAELTGHKERKLREALWKSKRVFFITPQVLQNDLESVENLGADIRCIIFDEAHKARGNHAYVEVMRKLVKLNEFFRVLALSATPGKDVSDIIAVIKNLLISHLEFRTEESLDVRPYVFQRTVETIVVPLDDKMLEIKNAYLNILEGYTRCLMKHKIIQGNCSTLTKGKIFIALKDFQTKNNGIRHANYSEILRNLNICVTLYHAYELLIRHGLRSFVCFFDEHLDKPLLRGNLALRQIIENVKIHLGQVEPAERSDGADINEDTKPGHPKFTKLREILSNHFKENKEETRVIVFFEYRESAKEGCTILLRDEPLIRPRVFLGQNSGMTQKDQLNVIQAFKQGKCNTLLSTCIGEEGLDVGEIDLIVCFDISNKSPIRMIQRSGRTGRKRQGRVIVLVTQGKEQQTLEECLQQKKFLTADITTAPTVRNALHTKCPRMVPADILPCCEKVYFTVVQKAVQKKNLTIADMFQAKYNPSLENNVEIGITTIEKSSQVESLWDKSNPLVSDNHSTITCRNIDELRRFQPYVEVGHSTTTQTLVSLLQMADCKRFNIPLNPQSPQRKNLVQGDIRDIFRQSQKANAAVTQSQLANTPSYTVGQDLLNNMTSNEICAEIADFLSIRVVSQNTEGLFHSALKYPTIPSSSKTINFGTWMQPNMSILSTLTKSKFLKFVGKNNNSQGDGNETDILNHKLDDDFWDNLPPSTELQKMHEKHHNIHTSVFPADNIDVTNQRNESEIIDLLSFFKLPSLYDIFTVPKLENYPNEINDMVINVTDFRPESPVLSKSGMVSQIRSRFVGNNSSNSQFNSSFPNADIKSHGSQSTLHELSNFVNIGAIFDVSLSENTLETKKGNPSRETVNNSGISVDCMESKSAHPPLYNIQTFCNTDKFDTEDICDFSHFGLSEENIRKRRHTVSEHPKDEDGSANKQSNAELCPLVDLSTPDRSKRPYMSHESPSSIIEKKNVVSTEQSQMSITQILSFIDKKELSMEQNYDQSIHKSHVQVKNKNHFDDLLDKMV